VNALGIVCPNGSCKSQISTFIVNAQLENQIRRHISCYYENWLVCDEPACATRTRQMNVYGKRCLITGCRGQMTQEYNDKMLYNQLLYYDMLFDIEKAKKKTSDEDKGNMLSVLD
jgi:DNA polymerase alpha subunit A